MKITIPTSWKDVTLNQYVQLAEVPSLGFDYWDTQFKILEILTGVSDEIWLTMSLVEVKKFIKRVDFINTTPNQDRRVKDVTIEKRDFRVNYDIASLTAGEFIDLSELTKDPEKINENIIKIIAIYMRPVNMFGGMKKGCYEKNKHGLLVQTLESRLWTEERIGDCLTMDLIFPMSGFFLTLWETLIKATEHSSLKRVTRMGRIVRRLSKGTVFSRSMAGT
jgi:hypothetical protein